MGSAGTLVAAREKKDEVDEITKPRQATPSGIRLLPLFLPHSIGTYPGKLVLWLLDEETFSPAAGIMRLIF